MAMVDIMQAEVVFDEEGRQIAVFFTREDWAVLEKHYRRLPEDMFNLFVDIVHDYLGEVDPAVIERKGNRFIIYGDIKYVIALTKALDRRMLGE